MADAFHIPDLTWKGLAKVLLGAGCAFSGGFVAMLWIGEPGPHTCRVETVELAQWVAPDPASGVPVQYGKSTSICHDYADWEAF